MIVALALAGCASSVRLPPESHSDQPYHLGPGDVVAVTVWHEPQLASRVVVRPDGMISLPLVKDVAAAGLSASELRQKLAALYRSFVTDPEVSVDVAEINSYRVAVLGNVKAPGQYSLVGGSDVLQMLARAGGLDVFATGTISVIRHKGDSVEKYSVNYDAIIHGDLAQDITLTPGDVLVAL